MYGVPRPRPKITYGKATIEYPASGLWPKGAKYEGPLCSSGQDPEGEGVMKGMMSRTSGDAPVTLNAGKNFVTFRGEFEYGLFSGYGVLE